jgi:hypothetical protein
MERGNDAAPRTLDALAGRAGNVVAVTPGAGDFAPGRVRYSFLVLTKDGQPVERPRATVWISRGREQAPFQRTTARLEPIGLPGTKRGPFDLHALYVTRLDVPDAGTYWLLARPNGARIAALGNLVVKKATDSPAIGAQAPRSWTPTLASTGGRVKPLTTAPKPDRELYRTSVAAALRAHVPFVVAFATPAFCASRTCGPVVDVVSHVRRSFAARRVRFIHVEVYAHNDPSRGYNRWMKQWHLMSEPWVFLVGADGRIKEKFEGSVSVDELRTAVQRRL